MSGSPCTVQAARLTSSREACSRTVATRAPISCILRLAEGRMHQEHQAALTEFSRDQTRLRRDEARPLKCLLQIDLRTAADPAGNARSLQLPDDSISRPARAQQLGTYESVELVVAVELVGPGLGDRNQTRLVSDTVSGSVHCVDGC